MGPTIVGDLKHSLAVTYEMPNKRNIKNKNHKEKNASGGNQKNGILDTFLTPSAMTRHAALERNRGPSTFVTRKIEGAQAGNLTLA